MHRTALATILALLCLALAANAAIASVPPTFTVECTGVYGGANGITTFTDGGFWVETQSGPSYLPITSQATALPPAGIAWLQAEEDSAPLTAALEYDCRYAPPTIPDTAMAAP